MNISELTDEQLKQMYFFSKENEETLSEIKNEISKRGIELTEEEKALAHANMEASIARSMKPAPIDYFYNPYWKDNVVKDPGTSILYSQGAVYLFSFLFSVLFGAVMLSMNLNTVGKKNKMIIVIITASIYFILSIMIGDHLKRSGQWLINGIGSVVLTNFFWTKYIGFEFKYQRRPIIIPAIIGIGIATLFFLAIIATL